MAETSRASDEAVGSAVDYNRFLECVHCGLCTSACPTFLELGTEMDSPRGRIHIMRAVTDGRMELTADVASHLELCLDCRACETACPSGVRYGQMIEPFRVAMRTQGASKAETWFERWLLFRVFPYPMRMRMALAPVRIMQRLGLHRLLDRIGVTKWLPAPLPQMHAMLPRLTSRGSPLPERIPAKGKRRAVVALLTGCIADAMFHHVHWATVRVLQENGCDVLVPRGQVCCGAIHYHAGYETCAVQCAIENAKAIDVGDIDAVITNVAGCGAMLKDYGHLHVPAKDRKRVENIASKARDILEFLVELGPIKPKGAIDRTAVYHDACHLAHAQQIRSQPRSLLEMIPGLRMIPLIESEICCGAAGTYNLTQPDMAKRLAARKAQFIAICNAEALFVANPTCAMHIGAKLREQGHAPWIAHPIEALDLSYRNQPPPDR